VVGVAARVPAVVKAPADGRGPAVLGPLVRPIAIRARDVRSCRSGDLGRGRPGVSHVARVRRPGDESEGGGAAEQDASKKSVHGFLRRSCEGRGSGATDSSGAREEV
jgi:hypothetical protein